MASNVCTPRIVVLSTADLIGPGFDPDPVGTALGNLETRDAHVIRQAYLGDRKQPDRVIAATLGIDRSRVTRIRHRALQTLRTELEPLYPTQVTNTIGDFEGRA